MSNTDLASAGQVTGALEAVGAHLGPEHVGHRGRVLLVGEEAVVAVEVGAIPVLRVELDGGQPEFGRGEGGSVRVSVTACESRQPGLVLLQAVRVLMLVTYLLVVAQA